MHGIQLWVALPGRPAQRPGRVRAHLRPPARRAARAGAASSSSGEFDGATSKATTYYAAGRGRADDRGAVAGHDPAGPGLRARHPRRRWAVLGARLHRGRSTGRCSTSRPDVTGSPWTPAATPRCCCSAASRSPKPLVMWWNFIGRDHDEIVAAREDWEAQRGTVRLGRRARRPAHPGATDAGDSPQAKAPYGPLIRAPIDLNAG